MLIVIKLKIDTRR